MTALDAGGGTLRVSTRGEDYTERFTLGDPREGGRVQERVVFPPDPGVTGWLARAAALVPEGNLARAAAEDPTNPFLALREARLAAGRGDNFASLNAVRRSLGVTCPFPPGWSWPPGWTPPGFPPLPTSRSTAPAGTPPRAASTPRSA